MEPAHSETGDCRVEPPASILVARLSMSHLVPLLEFNHLDGRIAQPLVVLEMAANKNELRAQLARPSAWHTPADPVGPGFVRSSEHDSATDSDRLAAQRWIEQLLDRSIERIQVRMKDRGSRFQLFFVHQEQVYPRCKLSERRTASMPPGAKAER